jgi:hypothetical protein
MDTLRYLTIAPQRAAREIIKTLPIPVVNRISEAAYNALYTDLGLSRQQLTHIHSQRRQLLRLSDKRTPGATKRAVILRLPLTYLQFLLKLILPLMPA